MCVSLNPQNSPIKGYHHPCFTNTETESHEGPVNCFLPENILNNLLRMCKKGNHHSTENYQNCGRIFFNSKHC